MTFWSKLRRLVSPSGQPAPPELSSQQLFTAEVVAALRQAPGVTGVVERSDAFALTVQASNTEHVVYLGNVFVETRDLSPTSRAARIRRFVSALGNAPTDKGDWQGVRDRLVPLLRASSLGLNPDGEEASWLRRGFTPFLMECVGIDADDSFQLVTPSQVPAWNVTAETVFATARENATRLLLHAEHTTIYDPRAPYPLWHVSRDDSYESSRLLLPGWLASFAGKVNGRPVAIAPHRSFVLVGGDGDEACVERLIETARREHAASPRCISPALYTVDAAGAVVPLALAREHRLFDQVALGHMLLATTEYQTQQPFLQRKHGEALYVAAHNGVQSKDGTVFSFTTWTERVPSLLPQADQIVFLLEPGGASPRPLRVPWARAVTVVGDCLVPEPGIDPPRWRTARWPGEEILARLAEAAIA